MSYVLEQFDNIVTNVANSYRLQEECAPDSETAVPYTALSVYRQKRVSGQKTCAFCAIETPKKPFAGSVRCGQSRPATTGTTTKVINGGRYNQSGLVSWFYYNQSGYRTMVNHVKRNFINIKCSILDRDKDPFARKQPPFAIYMFAPMFGLHSTTESASDSSSMFV